YSQSSTAPTQQRPTHDDEDAQRQARVPVLPSVRSTPDPIPSAKSALADLKILAAKERKERKTQGLPLRSLCSFAANTGSRSVPSAKSADLRVLEPCPPHPRPAVWRRRLHGNLRGHRPRLQKAHRSFPSESASHQRQISGSPQTGVEAVGPGTRGRCPRLQPIQHG